MSLCIKFKYILTINGVFATTEDIKRLLEDLEAGKVKITYYNGFNVITD